VRGTKKALAPMSTLYLPSTCCKQQQQQQVSEGGPSSLGRQIVRVLWSGLCDAAPKSATIHQTSEKAGFSSDSSVVSVEEPHNPLTQVLLHR
jgi:hypothetical protein